MSFEYKSTSRSFYNRFSENTSKSRTYKEAYELTEKEHIEKFGTSKYSGYDSFRTVKSRNHNKV